MPARGAAKKMTRKLDIVALGDVHGEFGRLNNFVNHRNPQIVLQCGDFGYWPNLNEKRRNRWHEPTEPKMHETKLYWCDGNHEEFTSLADLTDNEVYPNVFWMKRGSTLDLPDGRKVLFLGDAKSVDQEIRLVQEAMTGLKLWFPEEQLHEDVVRALPEMQVDIVVSHAAPREFRIWGAGYDAKEKDPTRLALSLAWTRFRPKLWFFGHYHARIRGEFKGTEYFGLNMAGCSDWWVELPGEQEGKRRLR